MGKLLDVFWLFILILMVGFVLLWGLIAIAEGIVCFGSVLIGLGGFFTRVALIPFFKGGDGGLV